MAEAYPVDQPNSQKREFSPFALLKVAVSDYLLREQLEQLAVLFELSPREREQFNNNAAPGLAFIRILEKRCLFTAMDVDRFVNGLLEIRNIQLAEIVRQYKRDHISNLVTNISGNYQSYRGVNSGQRGPAAHSTVGNPSFQLGQNVSADQHGGDQNIIFPVDDRAAYPDCVLFMDISSDSMDSQTQRTCVSVQDRLKHHILGAPSGYIDHLSDIFIFFRRLYGDLKKISFGSIQFYIRVPTLSALDRLRKDCESGSIKDELKDLLLPEDVRTQINSLGLCLSFRLDFESVREVRHHIISRMPGTDPEGIQGMVLFCDYCKVSFDEEWEHEYHIKSQEHLDKIAPKQISDKSHSQAVMEDTRQPESKGAVAHVSHDMSNYPVMELVPSSLAALKTSDKSHSQAEIEDTRQPDSEGAVAHVSHDMSNYPVMELVPSSLASLKEISSGPGAIFGSGNVVLTHCVINVSFHGNRSGIHVAAIPPEREPQSVDQEDWYFTPFAVLKLKLCDKLGQADIVKLANHFDLEYLVADGKDLSPLKFFEILERKNLVSAREVDRLLEGLFAIENEPLVAAIAEYKKEYVAAIDIENESVSMTLDDTQRIPAVHSRETEVHLDLPTDDHRERGGFQGEDSTCTPSRPTIRFPIDGDHNPLCGMQLIILPQEEENNTARGTCSALVKHLKNIVWAASGCLDHLTNVFFCLLNSYGPLIEMSDTADGIKFHLGVNSLPHLESLQEDVKDGSLAKELMQLLLAEKLEEGQGHQIRVSTRLDSDTIEKRHSFLISQSNKQPTVEGLQSFDFFCDYCKVFFDEEWQHNFHINSDGHQKNIASKQGNEAWTEREPPLKITNGNFKYCANVVDKSCEYTGKKGTENKCPFAHTAGEFEEWKRRHRQRLKVIQRISDQTENISSTRGSKKGRRKKSKWTEDTSAISEKIAAKAKTIKSVGSIKYSKEYKIAQGSIGGVFLGKFGGSDVAVKKIENDHVQKEPELFKKMELEELSNVLKILCIEKDEDFTYIVTALCEYDLKTVMESENNPIRDHLTPEKRVQLCVDILRGLKHLHSMNIIHRDLKPNNILLDVNGQAFVADFGISRNVTGMTTHVTSCYGTLCWLARESVSTSKDKTVKCKKESDVQVAGFLIYYILSDGHHPFEASFPFIENHVELMNNLSKGEFSLSHLQDYHYPFKCTSLLTSMLDQDMSKRPTIDQCLEDMEDIHKLCIESAKKNVLTLDEVTFNMPDVKVVCKPNCIKYLPGTNQKKKHKLTWTLHVTCKTNKLVKIYLWRNQSDTFSLSRGVGQLRQQELDVRDIQKESSGSFGIFVNFESKKRGAFHQWLVFDFGAKPVLCHQFLVWVGPNFAKYFHTDDDSTLWDLSNHEVVRYPSDSDPDPLYEKLEAEYPLLEETGDEFSTPEQLTPDNFQEYFHDMVYDEERAYIKRLKQFNGHQEVYLKQRIDVKQFKVKSLSGQLFGEIKWKVPLDDSEASQIVTKSVQLALLKFESSPEVIYEAEIVARRRLDLREVDHFVVSLSPECVTNQGLKSDDEVPVNVQFKVDRKIFCFYHYAIDNLKLKELLFPPRNMFPRFLEEQTFHDKERVEEQSDFILNHRQEETRKFLSGAREAVPFRQGPSLIIGPFGTGKTSTLARTVVDILESDPSSKLLICTHSNSAADLFFKKFLDGPQNLAGCFFRIYATERDPATVDDKIRGYCNFDFMTYRLTKPFAELEEMSGYRVVITTLANSIHLADIPELRGHFSHIFIDEAGQALETEAMIPLGLAEPRTVVVLAGDHKQMRPKVYSKKAKKCNFQQSMLERLFYWSIDNNCNNFHFLTENYRILSPEILSFIGEHCYHVKNFAIASLRSKDQQRASGSSSHPSMVFSAISGEDKLEKISYYNEKEVTEIVQQILELKKNWPSEWNDFTDKSVAVLTPYKSQVQFLRESLKGKCPVNIHTVQNSQGEQFEVVFISTVRTRHTIAKDDMPSPSLTRNDPDYYGVLSDEGELTTALTRARSLLWVVGDPISLCSVGKCQKIWNEYIQNCGTLNSLKPSDVTWPAIKEKLAALTSDAPAEEDEGDNEIATSLISTTIVTEAVELLQSSISQDSDTDAELEEVDDDTFDLLMYMWEEEVEKDLCRSDSLSAVGKEEPSNGADGQQSLAQPQPSSRRKRRHEPAYGMQHGDAGKVIWFKLKPNRDISKLRGTYDEEVEEGPEELDDTKRARNIQLAKNDPENYCIAVLQFAENHLVHGIPLESRSHDKIVISSKFNRKNALDGDQVVLQKWKKRDVTYGKVKCVLKRAEDLKWKKIVCALDPENVDLMCPVDNEFLPKLCIYKKGAERTEDGDVTFGLYHITKHERKIHEKSVTVKSAEIAHKLFVVRYCKWGDTFAYPLGIVTEELPPCDSLENGLKVLRMKHGVREKWPDSVKEEIERHLYHEKWAIPKTELNARKENDLTTRSVFTIGKSDLSDRDSAIHVEKVQNGKVKLGFHLADVPFFIEKGSCMDEEALRRGCSFFDIHNKPSHMLPDVLSTNLCIFKENSKRLSVSFALTLSLDECLNVENVEMYRSVVCCKQNLTFERVEAYLLNKYDPSFEFNREVMQQIELLYKVMHHFSQVPQLHSEAKIEDQVNFPLAYSLVEGVRKLVNVEVSKILNGPSQHNIPVCLQLNPKEAELLQWHQTFKGEVQRIPHLPTSAQFCEGKRATYEEPIPVLQSAWEEVGQILKCGKDKILELKKLLGCSEVFPKQVAALANLSNIIPQEEYTFTPAGNGEICFPHFSLQEDCVHPFMSPVRSFIDLVVLRMLVASLQNAGNPYSNDDLTHITYHCTKQIQSAQKYKKRAQVLELAFNAKVVPHYLQAVIHSASEDEITLTYPFKGFLEVIQSLTGVPLRLLKPAERPVDGEVPGKSLKLNWKNRIYNYNGKMIDVEDSKHDVLEEKDAQGDLWLITDGHVKYIPFSYWDKMMQSVHQEKYKCLEDLEKGWKQANTSRSQTKEEGKVFVDDVTCEKRLISQDSNEVKKYVKFFRQFNPGDVLDVQLFSDMQQGSLTPGVQLLKMTTMHDLCLEHRNMPVECFTEIAERMPPICRTVDEYVEAWLPMLKMMVAYNTIVEDETIVIHNIPIRWSKEFLGSSREIYGHFSLEKKWCDDRQILFSPLPKRGGSPRGLLDETQKFLVSDYICVRFSGQGRKDEHLSQSEKTGLQPEVSVHKGPVIVVHGVAGVTNIGRPAEEDNYDVMFQVTKTSCDILKCVFDESGSRCTNCSVELIPKSESEKRMEGALMNLENSSALTRNIILQNPDGIEKSVVGDMQQLLNKGSKINHKSIKRLFPQQTPNQFQSQALRKALSQPFTVIRGPPGTGKTRTGAYLTAFFANINKEVFRKSGDKPPQILYCGPSNKSVDVIAQFLQKLSKTVKLSFVRVYSDSIEQQSFPVPGVEGAESKFTYSEERHMPEEVKKNALHHIIRSEEAGDDGKAIKDMDRKFKAKNSQPSLNVVRHYKEIVRRTKIRILKSRDVVLCTCNAAGHVILKGNLNIVQCIIDEAGMCFELDNLIPLVCHRPKQVVLIGDHKQLRPIIQHPRAKQLGAEISLMEKYKESAYMIRTQYRMHEEICRFPSEEFYDGSLITDQSVKDREDFLPKEVWPGEGQHPRVFCHIVGEEYAQTILTSDGGELSKSNEKEACEVVRIVRYLLEELKVDRENLVVLSQYKLQCSLLRKKLSGLKVGVHTIIKSQGSEWDFVLLSTVRSLPDDEIPERPGRSWRRKYLGYIEDENQMNVGITRARQGLIIVGNKYLLATCSKWQKLIQHYEKTGSVVDAENFLKKPRN